MKTVGILGGFGPQTTIDFQQVILNNWSSLNLTTRPAILTWNSPIPIKIESQLLSGSVNPTAFIPFLINGAKLLQKGGADFISMPCNTLHFLHHQIQASIRIPILNLIDITIMTLKNHQIKKVLVLATNASLQTKLHLDPLNNASIVPLLPNSTDQQLIDKAILQINTGINLKKHGKIINRIIATSHTKACLLGCTDLQQVIKTRAGCQIFDSLGILAQTTVKEMLK